MPDTHLIQSLDDLASLYGSPRPSSQNKLRNSLTDTMQLWLQHCPFFILSSQGPDGIDCSPRGDTSGEAFRILDPHRLAIPDRRGNNRIDTLKNIIADPRVGLLFLIPGVEEALRVKGIASISIEPQLLQQFSLDGEPPATVMIITISSAYVQNARAIRKAALWQTPASTGDKIIPSAKDLYL